MNEVKVGDGAAAPALIGGRKIEISVNNKPVMVDERLMTGLEVKQAAIDQGVNIKIDFLLFHDLNNGQQVAVKDHETILMHRLLRFDAVTNDDNS